MHVTKEQVGIRDRTLIQIILFVCKDFNGLPVMSDELHVVSLVTLFDAVHADGVAVCCVTGVAPAGTRAAASVTRTHSGVQSNRLTRTTSNNATSNCELEQEELPVKIVHWVAGVT